MKVREPGWRVSIGVLLLFLLAPLALGEEMPRIDLNKATLSQLVVCQVLDR